MLRNRFAKDRRTDIFFCLGDTKTRVKAISQSIKPVGLVVVGHAVVPSDLDWQAGERALTCDRQ
jgi:hypothetical protein